MTSQEQVADMLARASSRVDLYPSDARAGALFEKLEIDGDRYFLKQLSPTSDWIMRLTGDRDHRPYLVWRAGLMDGAPACIDHTVVAMQLEGDPRDPVLSILMRDVSPFLVPEGDDVVSKAHHEGFLDHMAALSAAFWGWRDVVGLTTLEQRFRFFSPDNIAPELKATSVPGPIAAADSGWRALPDRSPVLARSARAVWDAPELLTDLMAKTPVTFLHGDWKMGNLGTHRDGRTILLDWAYPGSGPACWDLCWYLALNQARLPEQKETALERFRAALDRHGVSTEDWWETQLDLCVIGIMATFAWEKALGDEDELRWWEDRVHTAIRRQRIDVPPMAK